MLRLAAIKSYKNYKNYKMTINAGYVENAPTLAQPGSALFRYVAKMAAVEYEKCTSPHTSWFDRFQYTYFHPIWIRTPYVFKLVSTASKYG